MTFSLDFQDMCTAQIVWAPLTGRDEFTKPTYGTQTTYFARKFRKNKLITTKDGKIVPTTAQVWVIGLPSSAQYPNGLPPPPIDPQDYFMFLDDNTVPVIAGVDRPEDETAEDAVTKVYLL
jgi:hypothetical protein